MKRSLEVWFVFTLALHWAGSAQIDRTGRNIAAIPDSKKNTADLIEKWGYQGEEHDVMTSDGYTLTLFRIPHGVKNVQTGPRVPVLMQHGIYLNSDQWVLRGAHDLPFLLAEMGYDVWMSNTRGTRYSRHRRYTSNDFLFWNYSIDELGTRDLPAVVDYVLNSTRMPSLSYIGHSRGCAMVVMLLSEKPEYNDKIHMLQLLAPVIYTKYAPCPLYHLAGNRPTALMETSTLQSLMKIGNIKTLMGTPGPLKPFLRSLCSSGTTLDRLCPFIYFFVNGDDIANFNTTLTPMLIDHFSVGTATKEIIHLLKISENDEFQKYDYGKRGNIRHYGSVKPPSYNIRNIRSPVYIYYGPNDLFIDEKDLKRLYRALPNLVSSFRVPYAKFNHIDYFWGKNTNQILFPTFLNDIKTFHSTRDNSQDNSLSIIP